MYNACPSLPPRGGLVGLVPRRLENKHQAINPLSKIMKEKKNFPLLKIKLKVLCGSIFCPHISFMLFEQNKPQVIPPCEVETMVLPKG
jgi:hypothetical protein